MSALLALRSRWAGLTGRERRSFALALAAISLLLGWLAMLAPALHTLNGAGATAATLDTQLQSMDRLQQRARLLRGQAAVTPIEATSALRSSLAVLGGGAHWAVLGSQLTVTLNQIPAEILAQWLGLFAAPAGADRLLPPAQMHLVLERSGSAALWHGTVVFELPSATRQ
jgi:type II secretory pathway component PulM